MDAQVRLNNDRLYRMVQVVGPHGDEVAAGWIKLAMRFLGRQEAVRTFGYLTPTEERGVLNSLRGLFGATVRFVVKRSAQVFLVSALVETVYDVIFGGDGKTWTERVGIVSAHILKGSSQLLVAFAAIEQGFFLVYDAIQADEAEQPIGLTVSSDIFARIAADLSRQVVPIARNVDP